MMIKVHYLHLHPISLPHSTMSKPVKTESVVTIDPNMIASDDEDDDQKAMKKPGSSLLGKSKVGAVRCCQADKCGADLATAKPYHKRHKVCEVHAKAQVVLVNGIRQRFCQQCSRFHEVSEFDESKRSCRSRLAGHNERRRRKSPAAADSHQGQEMSSSRKAGMVCGRVNNSYSASEKHFHIR